MQGPVWLYRLYIYRSLRQSHIYIYTFPYFTYIYPSNLYRVGGVGRYVDPDPSKALACQCLYGKFVTTRWSLQTPNRRYSPPEEPKPSVLLKNRCRRIRDGPPPLLTIRSDGRFAICRLRRDRCRRFGGGGCRMSERLDRRGILGSGALKPPCA
jgi:hypothetical protein